MLAASERIIPHVHRTPILTSASIDEELGGTFYFKCENQQRTGAFKFRGACNAVLQLSQDEVSRGVATHSSGNHAAALTLAASLRRAVTTVVMPDNSAAPKRAAVLRYGGNVVDCAASQQAREETLASVVAQSGAAVVEPFDDRRVIAGQGTAAIELMAQVPSLGLLLAPVGGGGLLSGTALAAQTVRGQQPVVVGVEPVAADDTFRSFVVGRRQLVDTPDTIADGLRTSVGKLTFPIIQRQVERIVTVSERSSVMAMRMLWERLKIVVEPSGAVPLAALIEGKLNPGTARTGIILSGGNVDLERLPWMRD